MELLAGLAQDSELGVRSAAFRALTACCEQGDPEFAARVEKLLIRLSKDLVSGVRQATAKGLPAYNEQGVRSSLRESWSCSSGSPKDSRSESAMRRPSPCLPAV